MPDTRESDLVLAPNEYAYVLDQNSGAILPAVGPTKRTLENTERTVLFEPRTGKFNETPPSSAKQIFTKANDRSYVVLENPAKGDRIHPTKGRDNPMPELQWGKKQNMPGPVMFPLWPGQTATVLEGHQLRSNQYLVCVVDNSLEAMTNKAVVDKVEAAESEKLTRKTLKTGEILVIKGTEVSFYIPPTGISVLPEDSSYNREAVTLERLQYCILLDEDGNKRYEKGPSVVFPRPTETFIVVDGQRRFNAIELNDQMGMYIKVTADYIEGSIVHNAGDELFITGKEQKIYYPRSEHSIVKYGSKTRHYAIAIPKGEARYILDKETGEIKTVLGPNMYLPNPRKEVVVRRILSEKQSLLWYPGNSEVLEYNKSLSLKAQGEKYVKDEDAVRQAAFLNSDSDDTMRNLIASRSKSGVRYASTSSRDIQNIYGDTQVVGERMDRGTSYTPPRTITLDSKYEGAVVINIWPGFAVQVVSKTGERKVVIGPQSVVLDYDQSLEVISLSTGKPKTDAKLLETVFLQVKNNRVSDVVEATTKDMVTISSRVNYRLHFEGDPTLWFSVDNYVKFLTQNMRSIIRNEIKKHTIQDVSDNVASIIRDLILEKAAKQGDGRPGRVFSENGMRIIDVEILSLSIGDEKIAQQLQSAQYKTIDNAVRVAMSKQELEATRTIEMDLQETLTLKHKTETARIEIQRDIDTSKKVNEIADLIKQKEIADARDLLAGITLARIKKESDQNIEEVSKRTEIVVSSVERQMAAVQPGVIEAIIASANKDLAKTYMESIPRSGGGIGMVLGAQLIENLCALVKGSPVESALRSIKADMKTTG